MDDTPPPARPSARAVLSSRHPLVPVALSFCSGFVDVVCYLGLFHSFTAFITGTVIILGSELFAADSLLWIRAVILTTFAVSAFAWVHIVKWLVRTQRRTVAICLALECAFLALFMVSALALPVSEETLAPGTTLALVFATVAMALQNVAMQIVLNFHIPTTVMTGNFTRFVVSAIERIGGTAAARAEGSDPVASGGPRYGRNLAAFAGGAVLGAGGFSALGFCGLALPVGLIGALAVISRD